MKYKSMPHLFHGFSVFSTKFLAVIIWRRRRYTAVSPSCFWPPSPISPPCALLTTNAAGNAQKVWFASVTTRAVTNVSAQRKNDVQT